MKLLIKVDFSDKYNGKHYKIGDEIEVGEDRGKELLSDPRKLVAQIVEEPKKETKKKK